MGQSPLGSLRRVERLSKRPNLGPGTTGPRPLLVGPVDDLAVPLLQSRLDLRMAATTAHALEIVRSGSVDVVLVRLRANDASFIDILDGLSPHIPLVALVDEVNADAVFALLRRGLTDFVRLPLDFEELQVRLSRVQNRPSFAEPRWPGLDGLPAILAGELSGYGDGCFWISERDSSPIEDAVGATITVTALEDRAALNLEISMSRAGADATVTRLLGAPPAPQMVTDFLTEIANVSAGAMKRCMAACGLELTLGLPAPGGGATTTNATLEAAFDLVSDATIIRCTVASQPATFEQVPLDGLREGLVISRDLRGPEGNRLIGAGTRLTSSTIDHLRATLAQGALVEVIDAR